MVTPLPSQGGAAWLPDPAGRFEQRYWDGRLWTTAVMTDGQVTADAELLPEGEPGSPHAVVPAAPPVPVGPGYVPAPGPGDRYTSLRPDEASRRLGQMLQMQGWVVAAPTPDRLQLTQSIKGVPNTLIGLLLLLLWIIPGIIYFIVKSRTTVVRASLTLIPDGNGTRISVQGSPETMQRLGGVMVMLPW